MLLSAVVITQNEEANIQRCLASLRFADEIVVVDAFSEDRTVEIANGCGARVVQRRWRGFADQWQSAVDEACGDWVLLIAADEEVSDELAAAIRKVLKRESPVAGYCLMRRNQFLGKWVQHGPWVRDPQVRLFRKDRGHVTSRAVHEGVEVTGDVGTLEGALNHYAHQTLSESFTRLNRYTTLESEERAALRRIRLFDIVVPPYTVFLRYYLLRGCWRDGVRGYLLATITAVYRSVLYIKIRFLQSYE